MIASARGTTRASCGKPPAARPSTSLAIDATATFAGFRKDPDSSGSLAPSSTAPVLPPSCVRLRSLADGARGARPRRAPTGSAGGPHRLGELPVFSAAGAARGYPTSRASTTSQPAPPATAPTARAGLIEQSTRPHGLSIRPASTRPAGPIPADFQLPAQDSRGSSHSASLAEVPSSLAGSSRREGSLSHGRPAAAVACFGARRAACPFSSSLAGALA